MSDFTSNTTPKPTLPLELQEKLVALETALNEQQPMREILRDIHANLKADPENVTTLSDEEVAIIVNGLKRQTSTEIVTKAIKSKSTTAALKQISISDL